MCVCERQGREGQLGSMRASRAEPKSDSVLGISGEGGKMGEVVN